MQISDHFCEMILKKEWNVGDRVPSVREMAVQMEVNPNTAIRAFHFLQDENILTKKRGVGYFVAEDAYQKVMALKRSEFLEKEVPRFFDMIELLGLTCTELQEKYNSE